MSNEMSHTTIEILGKVYHIKCPTNEIHALQCAALYLEEKMRTVRDSGISQDRVIVITALNIVHQLLSLEQQKNTYSQNINQKLFELHNKLDHALSEKDQLEFQTAE